MISKIRNIFKLIKNREIYVIVTNEMSNIRVMAVYIDEDTAYKVSDRLNQRYDSEFHVIKSALSIGW